MNLNKVMLIGRLGKSPEVNYIKEDTPVAKFPLATSETFKSKDGDKKEVTEWHNIVAWRFTAKFCESYLEKGMLIYVEGKLQTRKWDGQDGVTRYSTEIVADQIKILERKGNQADGDFTPNAPSQKPAEKPQAAEKSFDEPSSDFNADIDDDLPF